METAEKKVSPIPIHFTESKEDTPYGSYNVIEMNFIGYKVKTYGRTNESAFILALEALARKMREE